MKIHEPPMKFSPEGEANWNKNYEANKDSGYGLGCLAYASEWATRMEAAMVAGETVEQCAKRTSHEADDEGITGFMYGVSVQILGWSWAHGEQLRRWHNLDTQIGNEGEKANAGGGVLNPALLKIG